MDWYRRQVGEMRWDSTHTLIHTNAKVYNLRGNQLIIGDNPNPHADWLFDFVLAL